MANDEISAGEYAGYMVDEVENLIVKVGRQLPSDQRIYGSTINAWKLYTREYFRRSPNAFLAENDCFNNLPTQIRVKLVKDQLLDCFQKKFDVLFSDPEFGFRADDKLITKVVASLSFEHTQNEGSEEDASSLLMVDIVSNSIYFIQEGSVDMAYKGHEGHNLVMLESGSYFGDVSYILQVKNQYTYKVRSSPQSVIYSLRENYLEEIFDEFPKFKEVLTIRALRRHHYFRKLKAQQQRLLTIRESAYRMCTRGQTEQQITEYIEKELLGFKKIMLIEDKLSYEDLIVEDNYSDEEVTITLNRQLLKDKKNKQALVKVKVLQKHIADLKNLTLNGMDAIVDTMIAVDESSKKMAYSHFDKQDTNILAAQSSDIIN